MKKKVDPYLRPLYDALYEMLPTEQVERRSLRARSRSRRSLSCAVARSTTLSSSSMRRRTPPRADEDVPHPFRHARRMVICGDPTRSICPIAASPALPMR